MILRLLLTVSRHRFLFFLWLLLLLLILAIIRLRRITPVPAIGPVEIIMSCLDDSRIAVLFQLFDLGPSILAVDGLVMTYLLDLRAVIILDVIDLQRQLRRHTSISIVIRRIRITPGAIKPIRVTPGIAIPES